MIKNKIHFGMFHKFLIVFVIGGVLPMIIIASMVLNRVFVEYKNALIEGYSQSLTYASSSLESKLNQYDEVSKLIYAYNQTHSYDDIATQVSPFTLKEILLGKSENAALQSFQTPKQKDDMENFLRYILLTNRDIVGTYFLDYRNNLFSYKTNSILRPETDIQDMIGVDKIDTKNKLLTVYQPHKNTYFRSAHDTVLTFSRNYYDVSGAAGQSKYLGTLFLDINIQAIDRIFADMDAYEDGLIYILDSKGICMYSNDQEIIGTFIDNPDEEEINSVLLNHRVNNQWNIYLKLSYNNIFTELLNLQKLIFIITIGSLLLLLTLSVFFTRQLVKPIRRMMEYMALVETGKFDIRIPVDTKDELGILAERFNLMSKELQDYINKIYVANLRQKEAELTSLRSQIYPHFLYNTLEVIRMTAVDNNDLLVSKMIEALSEQIHYIVGKVDDLVTLADEVKIIEKYVFLLNCRIKGELKLITDLNGYQNQKIPKLILQPIVENAYIHGIKPRGGNGTIMIHLEEEENSINITIMDNGIGMNEQEIDRINDLLRGDTMGIRNEVYWQSIGLKNVNDRIRYMYGTEFGIHITSAVGKGTMIRVSISKETPLQGGATDV